MQDIISELAAKKYLQLKDLKATNLWQSVPVEFQKLNPRQLLFHLQTNWEFPVCQCGTLLSWHTDNRCYRSFCSKSCTAKYTVQTKKQNNLKEIGVEWHSQLPNWHDKVKETSLEKYGQEHYSKTKEWQEATIHTSIKQFGVDHVMHRHIPPINLATLQNKNELQELIDQHNPRQLAQQLGVDPKTIHSYIHKHNIDYTPTKSYLEHEMASFLTSLNVEFIQNTRSVIEKELDFYIPLYNLAIEMNGDYWHSDLIQLNKNYHYNKWKQCATQNIHLLSIWESDWNNNNAKVKSLIKTLITQKQKGVGARKCKVYQITGAEARPFLDKYHLQGFVPSTSHWGAYTNDTLIAVMSFSWTRGNKSNRRFELRRWVTDEYTHPGLFSKVFKVAQHNLQFNNVVSFSDNRWFTGDLYKKTGFTFIKNHKPGYHYIYNNQLVHCSNFTKASIKKKFPELKIQLENGMSERKAMTLLNIPRTWDCGKKEWTWTK